MTMGQSFRKLQIAIRKWRMKCPAKDMKFMLANTKWSKEEIQLRYRNFILQCPDGKLTHQELCEQCKVLYRRSKPDKFCQYLISSLDKDGDQVLKEYMMGSYVWCHGTQFDQLLWAFELYDCDKNGILAREEVEEIFIAACKLLGKRIEPEFNPSSYVEKMFEKLDTNGDGQIYLQNFLDHYDKNESVGNLFSLILSAQAPASRKQSVVSTKSTTRRYSSGTPAEPEEGNLLVGLMKRVQQLKLEESSSMEGGRRSSTESKTIPLVPSLASIEEEPVEEITEGKKGD